MEVPKDFIAIDVFKDTVDTEGNRVLGRDVIHTQSETPLHLDEDSVYNKEYQPNRVRGAKAKALASDTTTNTSYRKKVIVDRNGNKHEINVPSG